jgi:hypothetical protein
MGSSTRLLLGSAFSKEDVGRPVAMKTIEPNSITVTWRMVLAFPFLCSVLDTDSVQKEQSIGNCWGRDGIVAYNVSEPFIEKGESYAVQAPPP